jgi:ABC-type Fe2+-enterobactin transport system substrate-binding protein
MRIKLSKTVLDHIVSRHPEVKTHTHKITETVQNPDLIVKGLRGESKALKFYPTLHIGSKYLVVVYRNLHE